MILGGLIGFVIGVAVGVFSMIGALVYYWRK